MNMTIELQPWIVPNFVIGKMPPRPKQDGIQEAPKWHLSEVDASDLARMCDAFRAEVFAKAGKPDPAQQGSSHV
ncbi:hypothetical protein UFOVP1601_10 [uncultured Caudovirales phage]|uniref:Uncharacterized protein n=1 Tax=uncultured Caudovirales phage TaxID=2100421 RepID=A0A6J5S341_9CAUD|nr:hypothetical protein UFOVP1154_20 [uncultured Caudovirales phage]CAB4200016.1 hypothetical protein UFOVP1341_17 [uncultured Caudovirales phage]CAB4218295.1 hypothetical protein UFOVP1601_10 [uncultured Caudovirales phage]